VLIPLTGALVDYIDPLFGLPPANEGAFEGGLTGTESDPGINNVLQAADLRGGGSFDMPTGGPPSSLYGAQAFTQRMLLFEEFGLDPLPTTYTAGQPFPAPPNAQTGPDGAALDAFLAQRIYPQPTRLANDRDANPWAPQIASFLGRALDTPPAEGRPPGEGWAHQRWSDFTPSVYFETVQAGARRNGGVRDSKQSHHYSVGEFAPGGLYNNTTGLPGFNGTTRGLDIRVHPNMPVQQPNSVWTFDGTLPPKLLRARYGESIVMRHYNALPIDPSANRGFGLHTITTHEHNGHNPAESDGFTNAFFFPGQYFDYRWPMAIAGRDWINKLGTEPKCGTPDGHGGITRLPGDYCETMSTHWFHDHMLDFTAQNVYKGNAAMMNYYSAIDRGNEGINDGVNLRLPSGTALDWGNRDYDVNLVIADKAWDRSGQLWFNIFNTDGFLGDRLLTNWQYDPYFEVRARRYRFRILDGCVSRYLKLALVDQRNRAVPFYMVCNDGNIMEHSVAFDGTLGTQAGILPMQGIAERYDIIIDFSKFRPGDKLYLVNLEEHKDGRKPERTIPLADVVTGRYRATERDDNGDGLTDRWVNGDPCVGKFLEFRVQPYTGVDRSLNPANYIAGKQVMIPLDRPSAADLATARHRTFTFGRSAGTDSKPWTVQANGDPAFNADPRRVSAAPDTGDSAADGCGHLEIWKIANGGNGWSHPVHVHFEEGQIIARGEQPPPEWEKWARKDMYRIGPDPESTSSVEFAIRVREFAGTYVEHCHNTQHEDHAMLLRWDAEHPGQLLPLPTPIPTWDGVEYVDSAALPTYHTGDGFGPSGGITPPPPPPNEVLTVVSAKYSASQGWRIQGTSTATVGLRVLAHNGSTLAGTTIGSASIAADGTWLIRVALSSSVPPDATNRISLESQGGATLLDVPLTRIP